MEKSVFLKGSKGGFRLVIDQAAALETVYSEVENLITEIKKGSKPNQVVELKIQTGDRLLTEAQQNKLKQLISEHKNLMITSIESNVVDYKKVMEWHQNNRTTLKVQMVRSGQIIDVEGDILLIGGVHPGGIVRASGNIFIIGELKGMAHAGFKGDESAVVISNLKDDAQIRIAENIYMVEAVENNSKSEFDIVFLNDLHILEVTSIDNLKNIRSELGKETGGFL